MYLDFVKDIIKKGDNVIVTCKNDTLQGIVVKINENLVAIQKLDNSIVVKRDNDITNIRTIRENPIIDGGEKVIIEENNHQEKARCGMILVKKEKSDSFHCSICGKDKVSKKYAIEVGNPNIRICNACYGWTLSRLENK